MAKSVNQMLESSDAARLSAIQKADGNASGGEWALIYALNALTDAVQAVAIAIMSRP